MGQESPAARAGQIARQMMLYGRPISNPEMMERLEGITIERLTDPRRAAVERFARVARRARHRHARITRSS